MSVPLNCVILENIHTPPMKGFFVLYPASPHPPRKFQLSFILIYFLISFTVYKEIKFKKKTTSKILRFAFPETFPRE